MNKKRLTDSFAVCWQTLQRLDQGKEVLVLGATHPYRCAFHHLKKNMLQYKHARQGWVLLALTTGSQWELLRILSLPPPLLLVCKNETELGATHHCF